jgi:hypothetical protein
MPDKGTRITSTVQAVVLKQLGGGQLLQCGKQTGVMISDNALYKARFDFTHHPV